MLLAFAPNLPNKLETKSFDKNIISFDKDIISFDKDIISFDKNIISFDKDIISFDNNIISFDKDIISFDKDIISFVDHSHICTHLLYIWDYCYHSYLTINQCSYCIQQFSKNRNATKEL